LALVKIPARAAAAARASPMTEPRATAVDERPD